MEELKKGSVSGYVQFGFWVTATLVTLSFVDASVQIGSDGLYGAKLVRGGDGTGTDATFSLLPMKKCVGLYKDPSCKSAFGFQASLDRPVASNPVFPHFSA